MDAHNHEISARQLSAPQCYFQLHHYAKLSKELSLAEHLSNIFLKEVSHHLFSQNRYDSQPDILVLFSH